MQLKTAQAYEPIGQRVTGIPKRRWEMEFKARRDIREDKNTM